MDWLKKRFSMIDALPIAEESKPSEFVELQEEMKKNKRRMKFMMAKIELQNKLLETLVKRIDPNILPPEEYPDADWFVDGAPLDHHSPKEKEEPKDDDGKEISEEEAPGPD